MVCLFSPCSLLVDVWLSALCCPPGSVSDRRWSVVWYTGGVPQHSGLSGRGLQHWEKSVDRARDWVQLGTRNKEQGEGMAQEPGWKADTFQMIQIEFFPLMYWYVNTQNPGASSHPLPQNFVQRLAWGFKQLTHLGFMENCFLAYFICFPGWHIRSKAVITFSLLLWAVLWAERLLNSSIISLWVGRDVLWLVTKAHVSPPFNGNIRTSHSPVVWLKFPVIWIGIQRLGRAIPNERDWQEASFPHVTACKSVFRRVLFCLTPNEWVPLLHSHCLVEW